MDQTAPIIEQADQQLGEADRIQPWTIKNVPPDARQAAIDAAKRENMMIGEWIARAIIAQVQADSGRNRLPAVIPPADPKADLDALSAILEVASKITASGAPQSVTRLANGILRDRLRTIAGGVREVAE